MDQPVRDPMSDEAKEEEEDESVRVPTPTEEEVRVALGSLADMEACFVPVRVGDKIAMRWGLRPKLRFSMYPNERARYTLDYIRSEIVALDAEFNNSPTSGRSLRFINLYLTICGEFAADDARMAAAWPLWRKAFFSFHPFFEHPTHEVQELGDDYETPVLVRTVFFRDNTLGEKMIHALCRECYQKGGDPDVVIKRFSDQDPSLTADMSPWEVAALARMREENANGR